MDCLRYLALPRSVSTGPGDFVRCPPKVASLDKEVLLLSGLSYCPDCLGEAPTELEVELGMGVLDPEFAGEG